MDDIRRRIRAALDAASDKSQKELAKLLNISPAQVTSLLKPGGRRLQAAEVPIVERYLGISLFKPHAPPFAARAAVARIETPRSRPAMDFMSEGTAAPVSDAPPDIARYLESVVAGHAAEVWRISTDRVREAGYLPGDYVVVDREQKASAGEVVLAEIRTSAGQWIPIFRVYAPPSLQTANAKYSQEPSLPVDDSGIAVIGPIVASVRARAE